MKRKITAFLLAVCMLTSMMPTALAAETGVTTEEALAAAVAQGGTVTLGADIDLTATLTVPTDTTVVLDLNGYTLTQRGTKDRHHYNEDGEAIDTYTGPLNGIDNSGTLTIGGGTVTGICEGKETGAWNCIYNAGTLTVNDGIYKAWNQGIYNGDSYYDEYGEPVTEYGQVTINGGTFETTDGSGVYNNTGKVTVNGGDFRDCGNYAIDNETENTDDVTIADGDHTSENFTDCRFTGGTFSGCRIYGGIEGGSFIGCSIGGGPISGGEFKDLSSFGASVAENANVNIGLKNAVLRGTFTRGTFSGTISDIEYMTHFRGGTFTKALKESLEAHNNFKFETGYAFVEDPTTKNFTVENVGKVKFNIKSSNVEDGKVVVSHYEHNGTSGNSMSEMSEQGMTKGGTITFSATATPNADHVFAGWFTNPEGTGTAVSLSPKLENFVFEVDDADDDGAETLYAVFKDSSEYHALVQHARDWLNEVGEAHPDGKYTVDSTADMFSFAYAVNHLGETFVNKTVTLTKDLDYTNSTNTVSTYKEGTHPFIPVGSDAVKFAGTFDGGNHTISNITLDGGYDQMGIFGHNTGTIKNLNVVNCSFTGDDVGGIAAWSEGTIENCSVTGCVLQGGFRYCGGIVGHGNSGTLRDVVSRNNTIDGWKFGAIVGYADELNLLGAEISDITLGSSGLGGLVASHVNAGTSTLENVQATDTGSGAPLIGTTYSPGTHIIIQGNETKINVSTIVPDTNGLESLEIRDGECQVSEPMIIEDETTLKLTGGTIVSDGEGPFAELRPGVTVEKKESDGDGGTVTTVTTVASGGASGKVDEYGNLILPAGSTVQKGDAAAQPLDNAAVILPNGTIVQGSETAAPTVSKDGSGNITVSVPAGGSVQKPNGETVELPTGGSATSGGTGADDTAVVAGVPSVTSFAITAPSQVAGGAIQVSHAHAPRGATVTITVTPDKGCTLDELIVTGATGIVVKLTDTGDGRFTFPMPASHVTIQVSFKGSNPFTDVPESNPCYEAVMWAVKSGVTNGVTATTFRPAATVSRAQMVTFLWRAHGSPEATGSNPFTDVSPGAYYYDAVLWAVSNGVTNGTGSTTFSPDASVPRAQAVTFQWRAAGSPVTSGSSFSDVAAGTYYADAVTWAASSGITIGTGSGSFSPETPVSRAQAVTFLYREQVSGNQ